MGQSETLLNIDMTTGLWEKIGGIVIGIVAGIVAIVLIVATAGAAAAIIGVTAGLSLGSIIVIGATGAAVGTIVGVYYDNEFFPDDLCLPMYSISAEEIFKGDIALFDIDFFKPKEVYIRIKDPQGGNKMLNQTGILNLRKLFDENTSKVLAIAPKIDACVEEILKDPKNYRELDENAHNKASKVNEKELSALTDIGYTYYYYYLDDQGKEVKTSKQDTAYELKKVVSQWYNALRNIAVVIMLSLLLYIGIRMMLSSLASDKAKYKQMLVDWLVGMCLLFFMHYIMAFSVTITKKVTEVVKSTYETGVHTVTMQTDKDGKLAKQVIKAGKASLLVDKENHELNSSSDAKDAAYLIWPTNLMGRMRVELQMQTGKASYIGYAICYMILVFYTVFFSFTYLKRVVYMAFLTIIAPLVAMTYPIDKLNDGQAQGFNKWLKEYIFNLLIQPLHLLLYTMLVSSAFEFAGKNTWYMVVAIGFLIPAEKLLRSFFGFEKASTPGSLAGAAVGAGLVAKGINGILHKVPGGPPHMGPGRDNGKVLDDDDNSKSPKMRFLDDSFDATAALTGGSIAASALEKGDNKDKEKVGKENKAKLLYKNPKYNQGNLNNVKKGNGKLKRVKYKTTSTLKSNENKEKTPSISSNTNNIKRPKRLKRALKAGGKRVFTRSAGRKLGNVGKTALRFAAGATLGGAAGTIGVAAGIASGDISNAVQYGAAGLGAGVYAGSKATDLVTNTAGYTKEKLDGAQNWISDTKDDMQREYYGEEEYKQRQQEKQIKEWKKDRENRQKLEDKMGIDNAKEMYESGEIDDYLKYGVDDASDMIAIHELQEENIAENREQAVAVHKYAQRTGDTSKMKKKDKDEWKNTFKEEFQKVGHSEENAEKASDNTFDMIERYNKIRGKL